jgi:hypothetical protein
MHITMQISSGIPFPSIKDILDIGDIMDIVDIDIRGILNGMVI